MRGHHGDMPLAERGVGDWATFFVVVVGVARIASLLCTTISVFTHFLPSNFHGH